MIEIPKRSQAIPTRRKIKLISQHELRWIELGSESRRYVDECLCGEFILIFQTRIFFPSSFSKEWLNFFKPSGLQLENIALLTLNPVTLYAISRVKQFFPRNQRKQFLWLFVTEVNSNYNKNESKLVKELVSVVVLQRFCL